MSRETTPLSEKDVEEIYQQSYDQPKATSSVDSDDESIEHNPYRFIKDWYLCTVKNPNKRLPLPEKSLYFSTSSNCKNTDDPVLMGWLQPAAGSDLEPQWIRFENLEFYCVERGAKYRGYWIATKRDDLKDDDKNDDDSFDSRRPLYWLQEPSTETPKQQSNNKGRSTTTLSSQEDVHFKARVALAVISLLCDTVFTDDNKVSYANWTVEKVLEKKPLVKTTAITKKDLLALETDILARHRILIGVHMLGLSSTLTKESKFLGSLADLRVQGRLQESDVMWWLEAAEEQLEQLPWGGDRTDHSSSALTSMIGDDSSENKKESSIKLESDDQMNQNLETADTSTKAAGKRKQPPELDERKRKRCRRRHSDLNKSASLSSSNVVVTTSTKQEGSSAVPSSSSSSSTCAIM